MRAESKELTVMFCDMRGFTQFSEQLPPIALQAFLNDLFSRLTEIISRHGGTVDKYMGDCVMAFWGAPVPNEDHATSAVAAALEMKQAVKRLRAEGHHSEVSVGIGINTGVMSVGDMGSSVRRSYTVVGDAVNLASRLEGLGATYGVAIVASASTMQRSRGFAWQELDCVQVRGRQQSVTICTPLGPSHSIGAEQWQELELWQQLLAAYRAQQLEEVRKLLFRLQEKDAKKVLYRLYADRLASTEVAPD
jgi:adenylate cyclase